MADRVTFSKEEIEANVVVPGIVEVELRHLVEDRLAQSGLYHRLFSRIKTSSSLERKYQRKCYNKDKKIQDLIGLRVDVYFEDDLRICRHILEQTFHLIGWSESSKNEVEFKPVKINGIFKLPSYLKEKISPETWDMCIDDTIEIQVKTVFFDGWHEIDHDMKYKGGELWEGKNSFSRYFNSILATLELCDKSLVTLFENLGHDLYKERNWNGMMKAHYRLKMTEAPLYPEVEEILDNDYSENNIGKQLFKTKRIVLVDELLAQPRMVPININTMIALVNKAVIHDDRLTRIFHEKDVFDDGSDQVDEEWGYKRLRPLTQRDVFRANVNLSTYRYSAHDACMEAARLTYAWVYEKYGYIDSGMPKTLQSYQSEPLGFRILMDLRPEEDYWRMCCMNVDQETPGMAWTVTAECKKAEDGRQLLSVRNSYATTDDKRNLLNQYFSCPKFYSAIADRIGIFDVRYLSTSRRIIKDKQVGKVRSLILSKDRKMPVCLIVSADQGGGWLNEGWLGEFKVYDLTRIAGRYTHIYTCSIDTGRGVLAEIGVPCGENAVYVFAPKSTESGPEDLPAYSRYSEADVRESYFGRHQVQNEKNRYDLISGGQAFYHKLLMELRSYLK